MSLRFRPALWIVRLWLEEIITLVICLGLDFSEIVFPPFMAPLVGDLLDLAGVVLCVAFFGWIGFLALIELIPGLDVLPFFTATWLIWYIARRRSSKTRMERQLERWR